MKRLDMIIRKYNSIYNPEDIVRKGLLDDVRKLTNDDAEYIYGIMEERGRIGGTKVIHKRTDGVSLRSKETPAPFAR